MERLFGQVLTIAHNNFLGVLAVSVGNPIFAPIMLPIQLQMFDFRP